MNSNDNPELSSNQQNDQTSTGKFQAAFQESNGNLQDAIQSLNCLQERVQSFVTRDEQQVNKEEKEETIVDQQSSSLTSVKSSVVVIQSLLSDTQHKCDRMVESNDQIAKKLDGQLGRCQTDMDSLRKELDYAHRCVSDLETNLMVTGSATESDNENQNMEHHFEITIYRLREENARLKQQLKVFQREILSLRTRRFGEMLQEDQEAARNADKNSNYQSGSNGLVPNVQISNLQLELAQTREAFLAMKHDRKRLKTEKCELLSQMKEVYKTLESKECELRDFIRQYEYKMRDSDKGLKELIMEKESAENEKRRMHNSLADAQQNISCLKTNLDNKDNEKGKLEAQLKELQGRFVLLTGHQFNSVSASMSVSSGLSHQLRTPSTGYGSLPVSPASLPDDQQVSSQTIVSPLTRQIPNNSLDDSEDSANAIPPIEIKMRHKARSRRESASQDRNRLSRLFGIGRSRSTCKESTDSSETESQIQNDPIAEDLNLAAKAEELLEARKIPIMEWRQAHIQAWLQLELGINSQQRRAFAQNVKSGKILLSLNDGSFSSILGVTHPMHKKKLRLAIEEYRAPSLRKFPTIREVTWQYVSSHFIPSCGLTQHMDAFRSALVDGRILNQINKRQLDKHLSVNRKFHQLSLMKGVDLLRSLEFDVKLLSKRRSDCERQNRDLLVWTNGRLQRWLEQIDLHEYSTNLDKTGLHGALAVLEPSFSSDTLATVLGIPTNKQMVRNHLSSEFTPILIEARSQLAGKCVSVRSRKTSHSEECTNVTNRSFTRSCSPGNFPRNLSQEENDTPRRRAGFRGSFGKVFGLRNRRSHEDSNGESRLSSSKSMPDANFVREYQGTNGTISSTTSDLGSSMERSQHMRTIIGSPPQVLVQAPLTETNGYGRSETSQSADSALSVDTIESSPPKTNNNIAVKMRSKSAGRREGYRPHSMGDFGSPPVMGVNGRRAKGMSSLIDPNFSAAQLHNWLSASDFKTDSETNDNSPPQERKIGPISEQTEPDAESELSESSPWNRSPGPSPGHKSRPQSLSITKAMEKRINRRSAQLCDFDVRETDL